ncbi:MAG: glutamate-5-semialdehyde dehydrogenase [Sutterellaceae bacterium]|nr:glutamate-5-semialdehyde dehydrogenase [Sutterellaceae bacterium]
MTDSSVHALMQEAGTKARAAARVLAKTPSTVKNLALVAIAQGLIERQPEILAANAKDVALAKEKGLAPAFVDRLTVTPKILAAMAQGARDIAALPDPIGEITEVRVRPNGMKIGRMRSPLGVLGMIYEARPNVTIDAAALAVKSGNAAILRGGSEAFETNRILGEIVIQSLAKTGIDPTADRDFVGAMIRAKGLIDVIIPRGGKSLIARLENESQIPMIHHLDGICHTYVDEDADLDMAVSVTDNAKTQRFSPCNAMENLLVHKDIAVAFLPRIAAIYADKGVEMRCDERALTLLTAAGFNVTPATEDDWDTEYNAPVIAIAVVDDIDAALDFIARHSSGHTDAIITNDIAKADRFMREVDSGSVMVNCSTRLADGFEYGLGAEIGISTGKLHARGPVGLEGLTNLKYVVFGSGQLRQ